METLKQQQQQLCKHGLFCTVHCDCSRQTAVCSWYGFALCIFCTCHTLSNYCQWSENIHKQLWSGCCLQQNSTYSGWPSLSDSFYWKSHRFIFHPMQKLNFCVFFNARDDGGKSPKWKTNTDTQAKPHYSIQSRSSHFSSSPLVSLCFSVKSKRERERREGEKKITAAWHQVWKSLLPSCILTFNSCSALLLSPPALGLPKRNKKPQGK